MAQPNPSATTFSSLPKSPASAVPSMVPGSGLQGAPGPGNDPPEQGGEPGGGGPGPGPSKLDRLEEFLRRRALGLPRGKDSLQYLLRCAETFANRLDPDCQEKLSPHMFRLVLRIHRDVEEQLSAWRDAPAGYALREKRYTDVLAGAEAAPPAVRPPMSVERLWDACRAYKAWWAGSYPMVEGAGFLLALGLGIRYGWYEVAWQRARLGQFARELGLVLPGRYGLGCG